MIFNTLCFNKLKCPNNDWSHDCSFLYPGFLLAPWAHHPLSGSLRGTDSQPQRIQWNTVDLEVSIVVHSPSHMFWGHFLYRADSRLAPSQWQTALQSNAISHWLGANLEFSPAIMHQPYGCLPCSGDCLLFGGSSCIIFQAACSSSLEKFLLSTLWRVVKLSRGNPWFGCKSTLLATRAPHPPE